MRDSRKSHTLRSVLNHLRKSAANTEFAYDVWICNSRIEHTLLWQFAVEVLQSEPSAPYKAPPSAATKVVWSGEETLEEKTAKEIYPFVCDILWSLAVRGVLRPGIRAFDASTLKEGFGYSLTLKGRKWITKYTDSDIADLLAEL